MNNDSFVVDASVVLSWCFSDESSDYSLAVLNSLTNMKAVVPVIWPLEITNVLLMAERRERLDLSASFQFIALLNNLPIKVASAPPDRIMSDVIELARTYTLSSYDASYLDLAMRYYLPLATLDKKLHKAALACDIPSFAP